MNANELRIGNFVKYRDKDVLLTVSNIGSKGFETINAAGFLYGSDDIEDYIPLPLTEEWLLKFGFSDAEYKKGYIGIDYQKKHLTLDFVLTKPKFMGEWQNNYCFDLAQNRFVVIKYVHQLQNLFFSLTWEDLKIKES